MERIVMPANQKSEWTRQLRRSGEQRRKPGRRKNVPWRAVCSRYGAFFQPELGIHKVTLLLKTGFKAKVFKEYSQTFHGALRPLASSKSL
jgi:hypothetical protein